MKRMKRRKIERKEGRNQGTKQAYLEGKKKNERSQGDSYEYRKQAGKE